MVLMRLLVQLEAVTRHFPEEPWTISAASFELVRASNLEKLLALQTFHFPGHGYDRP
jgi:hypothetical protein